MLAVAESVTILGLDTCHVRHLSPLRLAELPSRPSYLPKLSWTRGNRHISIDGITGQSSDLTASEDDILAILPIKTSGAVLVGVLHDGGLTRPEKRAVD